MAVVFKITNGDKSMEFNSPDENGVIPVFTGIELDPKSWVEVQIDKDDALELIRHLQRIVSKMD